MVIIKHISHLKEFLAHKRLTGTTIGFVPTMGALHMGHISLIEQSKTQSGFTVSSIFVNPTQFNNKEDFEKYPITLDADVEKLEAIGCDLLFLPSADKIYPFGTESSKNYELGYLETVLDGAYRPGHFQGVCQVVERLLQIVEPQHLFLGQKDYQQCMVITRLVDLMGWKDHLTIHICPTLRESDGLAMSSRNMRLSAEERKKATAIYACLSDIQKQMASGSLTDIKNKAIDYLIQQGFKPDYVEIAHAETLELLGHWNGHDKIVALAAAYLGNVRLIDNLVLN